MIMRPGSGDLFIWRLDPEEFVATWDSGIGAEKVGGRWNSKGVRAVYGSLDSSTAILEVAVHKGFGSLDTVRMMLTCARITDLSSIFTIDNHSVPNLYWFIPGTPSVWLNTPPERHLLTPSERKRLVRAMQLGGQVSAISYLP